MKTLNRPPALAALAVFAFCSLESVSWAGPGQSSAAGFENFEGPAAPPNWRALRGGALSISADCHMGGKHSLLWRWTQPRARIEVRDPRFLEVVAPSRRNPGSGFVFWLYNARPAKTQLKVFYGKRGKMRGRFLVSLNFKGWRSVYVNWTKNLGVKAGEVDTLVLEAPDDSPRGFLFIDCMVPKLDYAAPVPDKTTPALIPPKPSHWVGFLYFDQLPDPYARVKSAPPKALKDMRKLVDAYLPKIDDTKDAAKPLTDEALRQIEREVKQKYALERRGEFLNGKWIIAHPAQMPLASDEMVSLRWLHLPDTLRLVRLYRGAAPSPNRDKLLTIIFDLLDHLLNCGYAYGSRGGCLRIDHFGYIARPWPHIIALLRPELERTGRLRGQLAAMTWFAGLGRIKSRGGCNCDTLNTQGESLFMGVLLQPDDLMRYRLLRNFSDWLSHGVFCNFKPDGSTFHHAMHFPAYTYRAVQRAAWLCHALSHTAFRLTPAAHTRIKRAVYASAYTFFGPILAANIQLLFEVCPLRRRLDSDPQRRPARRLPQRRTTRRVRLAPPPRRHGRP